MSFISCAFFLASSLGHRFLRRGEYVNERYGLLLFFFAKFVGAISVNFFPNLVVVESFSEILEKLIRIL